MDAQCVVQSEVLQLLEIKEKEYTMMPSLFCMNKDVFKWTVTCFDTVKCT